MFISLKTITLIFWFCDMPIRALCTLGETICHSFPPLKTSFTNAYTFHACKTVNNKNNSAPFSSLS